MNNLALIFNGESPFNDGGQLETLDGHPEGAAIPNMLDAAQEFASGLDAELKSKVKDLMKSTKSVQKKVINKEEFSKRRDFKISKLTKVKKSNREN